MLEYLFEPVQAVALSLSLFLEIVFEIIYLGIVNISVALPSKK